MKKIELVLCLLIITTLAKAQTYQVEMVSNLSLNTGSNPRWLTVMNNNLFFFANDNVNGNKIFFLSPNGIPLICPNLLGNAQFGDGTTTTNQTMGTLYNKLYLPTLSNPVGRELYSYDNVNAPSLVMDINPGNSSANPLYFVPFDNKLFFQAKADTLGTELWVHDPTVLTTQCLTDINAGALHSTVAFITVYNNKLFFAGSNGNDTTAGNTGIELYCYDPILNTIDLISDIYPGYLGSNPTALMVANNKLYFVAGDPLYGKELYEYDGINVTRLTDINPGPAAGLYTSNDQSFPTYFNGKVYFAAIEPNNDINLGVFDIVNNTSTIIHCSGVGISGIPRHFKEWDNKLFFSNHSDTSGTEIWATDGVNAPFQVWDVYPGFLGGLAFGSYPKFFTVFDGNLFFNASNDTSSGEELFKLGKIIDTIIQPNTILEIGKAIYVAVSPLPVENYLTLQIIPATDLSLQYQIIDILGRKVMTSDLRYCPKNKVLIEKIDFSGLEGSTFFLLLKDKNGMIYRTEKVDKK